MKGVERKSKRCGGCIDNGDGGWVGLGDSGCFL